MNFLRTLTYAKTFVGRSEYTKVKALSTNSGRDKFLEEEISQLTDDELRNETQTLKSNISAELDFKNKKNS